MRAHFAPQDETIELNIMSPLSIRRGSGGKTGTAISPALRQAINAKIKSKDGGYTSKMRSPFDKFDL